MHQADWIVLLVFFLIMVMIGFWSYRQVSDSGDFFVAGGKLPWWLSGISHHISGYSGVVYVAYAGIAYTHGFTVYIWWALMISLAVFGGAFLIAPRWARLRDKTAIQSPTEYLRQRYSLFTQQLIASCGVLLKLFDVGAKWAAIAILMNVFADVPLMAGILLAGGICLIYITVGGLWADVWTDLVQFVIQIAAGFTMFFIVLESLGGFNSIFTLWDRLPGSNRQLFNEPYTAGFALAYLFINFFSYNGGTWNLATRYISSPTGSDARKAAMLSGVLYLLWPFILFFPIWAAPVVLSGIEEPAHSYALMAKQLLPPGMVGLVLVSLFASTMSMTSSDANTVSAVITRDILPNLSGRFKQLKRKQSLLLARASTFVFTAFTLLIAIYADSFGGILGLAIYWFGALIGPVAIPMILGLLPAFRSCGSKAAVISIFGGFTGFIVTAYLLDVTEAIQIFTPVGVSLLLFSWFAWQSKNAEVSPEVGALLGKLNVDHDEAISQSI